MSAVRLISLLALFTIDLMSVPALADEANVQTSEQITTQVGDRDTSTQRNKSNHNSRLNSSKTLAFGHTSRFFLVNIRTKSA